MGRAAAVVGGEGGLVIGCGGWIMEVGSRCELRAAAVDAWQPHILALGFYASATSWLQGWQGKEERLRGKWPQVRQPVWLSESAGLDEVAAEAVAGDADLPYSYAVLMAAGRMQE